MIYLKNSLKLLGLFFATAVIYFLHSIYSNYYQGIRTTESYRHAKAAATLTAEYFSKNSNYPKNINELKIEKPDLSHAGEIGIDKNTGVITIKIAGNALDEGILIFSPKITDDGRVSYSCRPSNVPIKYLPKGCEIVDAISNSTWHGSLVLVTEIRLLTS